MTFKITRILVPTDFSPTSDAALEYAREFAARFGATLHLLHVVEDPLLAEGLAAEAAIDQSVTLREGLLAEARARLARRGGGTASRDAIFGYGAGTIVDFAAQLGCDLIVMGTHGRTGVAHLVMGSVAERVVRSAPCPVLTVRQALAPVYETAPAAGASECLIAQ